MSIEEKLSTVAENTPKVKILMIGTKLPRKNINLLSRKMRRLAGWGRNDGGVGLKI